MKNDNVSNGGNVRYGAAPDLFTVEQAAGYLHLSTSTIRAYMRQGTLKGYRIAGLRKVLIPRHALLSLLEPTTSSEGEGEGAGAAVQPVPEGAGKKAG